MLVAERDGRGVNARLETWDREPEGQARRNRGRRDRFDDSSALASARYGRGWRGSVG